MKIREVDSYRIGLSIGEVEHILTCKETVKLCVKLLEMAVWVSEKADPESLQEFEFETATIDQLPPLDDELKAMLGHEEAILVQTSDEGGAIGCRK